MTLTHLDDQNRPAMVDVGAKAVTERRATAEALVYLPVEVSQAITDGDIQTRKGPVFQTAIIAGTMAVKKTSDLIPLCHPMPIEGCKVTIDQDGENLLRIRCSVKVHHKTGVEMEALTGVSIAALTVYDMCKALSHEIVIRETRLIEKHGGKSDFVHEPEMTP